MVRAPSARDNLVMVRGGWRAITSSSLALAACGRIDFAERPLDAPTAPERVTMISAYADQTCALFDGTAYCWGNNENGQLGDGTNIDAPLPTRVLVPDGADTISIGETSGCAIVAGELHCWGSVTSPTPALVALPSPATAVAVGKSFQCVIADVPRCWGVNDVGQCGTGNQAPPTAPTPIAFTIMYPATTIDAGDDHACAHAPGLAPQCWGHNDSGALGTGSLTPTETLIPVEVIGGIMTLPRIAGWHACALVGTRVRCWGEGIMGELGNGASTSSASPVDVSDLVDVTTVETGGGPVDHDASCAVNHGNVWCWGRGENGRLGYGMTTSQPSPVGVVGLPAPALQVALGFAHACALLVDGDVWCWGRGDRGQLGDGNNASSLTPVKVARPAG